MNYQTNNSNDNDNNNNSNECLLHQSFYGKKITRCC